MNGVWTTPLNQPAAGERLIDVNGVTLTLNATVKLVGTIVSLDSRDPHFGNVGVQLIHPNGTHPVVGETFFVHPSQLVVGS